MSEAGRIRDIAAASATAAVDAVLAAALKPVKAALAELLHRVTALEEQAARQDKPKAAPVATRAGAGTAKGSGRATGS